MRRLNWTLIGEALAVILGIPAFVAVLAVLMIMAGA